MKDFPENRPCKLADVGKRHAEAAGRSISQGIGRTMAAFGDRELKPILRVCLGIKVGLLESSMPRTQFAAQISTYLLGKEVALNSSLVSYSSCCRAHFNIMILSSFMSPHNSLSPNPVVKHATHEPL